MRQEKKKTFRKVSGFHTETIQHENDFASHYFSLVQTHSTDRGDMTVASPRVHTV